jgi:hypothetical protein
VAHVRQDERPGIRDGCRDIFDVLDLIASSWSPSTTRRLGVGPIRLIRPHLSDLSDERVVFLGLRRELLIFVPRPIDEVGKGRVLLDVLLNAGGNGVGGEGETRPTWSYDAV